ncbi:MAG: DUF3099 domain-containing protein [Dermatophilaceae bacterium]
MPEASRDTAAQVVTSAAESRVDDQRRRLRGYLVTMSIRTVCFVLMVVVDGWLRWVFAAGAVFLPFFAVVAANAVRPRTLGRVRPVVPAIDRTPLLTAQPAAPSEPVSHADR